MAMTDIANVEDVPKKSRMSLKMRMGSKSDTEVDSKTIPSPAELAQQLRNEGWPVPGFLLHHRDSRFVRPMVALSVLTNMLEGSGADIELEPYVYYDPSDPRHVPPYIAALQRQRQLWALQNLHPHPKSQSWNTFFRRANMLWTPIQYLIGTAISLTSIAVAFRGIDLELYESNIPNYAMAIIFIFLLIVIAYAEGYHVTVITLEKVDATVFQKTHPRAYHAHKLMTKNAECFVVGRQVLLTGIVFCVAEITKFSDSEFEEDFLFFPASFMTEFMASGVAKALIVLAFGQLLPQLISTAYPIHHMNLPFGSFLIRIMLFADWIGIADVGFWGAKWWRQYAGIMVNEEFGIGGDVVFGVGPDGQEKATPAVAPPSSAVDPSAPPKDIVNSTQHKDIELNTGAHIGAEASGEIGRRVKNTPVQLAKLFFSSGLMLGTFACTLMYIITGDASKLGHFFGAPWPITIIIHILLLLEMTYLEGLNLSVLALEKVPPEHIAVINPGAVFAHKLIYGDNGDPVRRFLLGRQFCVVWTDFLITKIGGFYSLAITVFLAQVMSQVVAATNPCYWMSLTGSKVMLMVSLALEKTGVCHFGWVVGNLSKWILEKVHVLKPEPFSVGNKVEISSGTYDM